MCRRFSGQALRTQSLQLELLKWFAWNINGPAKASDSGNMPDQQLLLLVPACHPAGAACAQVRDTEDGPVVVGKDRAEFLADDREDEEQQARPRDFLGGLRPPGQTIFGRVAH